jgi:hypothetical protein
MFGGEPLSKTELTPPLHLIALVAHLATETLRRLNTFDQPSAKAIVMNDPNIAFATARLDQRPSVRPVRVIADPTLQLLGIVSPGRRRLAGLT